MVGWITFVILELWLWFDMAGLDYQSGDIFPFRTAGWFVLGQPFVIPIFGFAAWVTSTLFKHWPRTMAILAAMSLSALLGTSIFNALPQQQLSRLIGPALAQLCEIKTMKVSDSFGDGLISQGTLVIGPEFIEKAHADPDFDLIKRHPDEHPHADGSHTIYNSEKVELRLTPDGKRCVFRSQH